MLNILLVTICFVKKQWLFILNKHLDQKHRYGACTALNDPERRMPRRSCSSGFEEKSIFKIVYLSISTGRSISSTVPIITVTTIRVGAVHTFFTNGVSIPVSLEKEELNHQCCQWLRDKNVYSCLSYWLVQRGKLCVVAKMSINVFLLWFKNCFAPDDELIEMIKVKLIA